MLTWWNCSLLRPSLQVKRQSEEQFTDLSARPEFNPQLYYTYYYGNAHNYYGGQGYSSSSYGAPAQAVDGAVAGSAETPEAGSTTTDAATALSSVPSTDPDKELAARLVAQDYSQVGTFNARTGRYEHTVSRCIW
jgi:hypothetical protein